MKTNVMKRTLPSYAILLLLFFHQMGPLDYCHHAFFSWVGSGRTFPSCIFFRELGLLDHCHHPFFYEWARWMVPSCIFSPMRWVRENISIMYFFLKDIQIKSITKRKYYNFHVSHTIYMNKEIIYIEQKC